ncbi:cyclase family protein [Bordetella holmesii]|uniref:Cyclase family protein n=2 Tax=Bordetella holmesii TaxID=35814 RepID=A0ABP3BMV4_9BORD|nr:cyclase family protein [Bordetella holmesii]AMD44953.1 cyclase [Bordetella holmesii H558]AOB37047.1 cyclase [Bordetella holmesii]AUL37685.1 cyclase [Bordetella holmesii]AUL40992.1 cyclase [Bordetella holmesii]AWP68415.1 cyclase [Bordetella holmesii]
MKRWTQRPEGSTWGDFGENDQLGRINLIGQEQVLKGIREVRQGTVFCLSLPLDLPGGMALNPRRKPPRLSGTERDGVPYMNFPMEKLDPSSIDVLSDDQVVMSLQYSTQWDALAHVGAYFDTDGSGQPRWVYYNGYQAGQDILDASTADDGHTDCCGSGTHAMGALKLGIENFAVKGMQGRAVLVDFTRHYGRQRQLIGHRELMDVMQKDNVTVERGDMLVLRTGFAELISEMAGNPDPEALHHACCVLDGADQALLDWISDSGIAAICANNYAVEAYPARQREGKKSLLPLHHHCLFKLGLPLAELWYLKDLAEALHAAGRSRFLLTAPPLRLPGAVGSPVTPIATI